MKKIQLNIFTNSTKQNSPSTYHITKTYESFKDTFGDDIPTKVWVDPHPNKKSSEEYIKKLREIFNDVNITNSLSDGYIKAIKSSDFDFLFMLEHDWIFTKKIKTDIYTILKQMETSSIIHFGFCKSKLVEDNKYHKYMKEVKGELFDYCVSPFLSNNPHIINRKLYFEKALPYLKLSKRYYGIEQELQKIEHLESALYGYYGYEPTVEHINGRKQIK